MSATAVAEEAAVVPYGTRPKYWAGHRASAEQIKDWTEQMYRDGYLLIKNVLTPDMCAELRADLDEQLAGQEKKDKYCELRMRMFEKSQANLRLFDLEPIVSFAESTIAPDCHVMHNNSFITMPGQGISMWHQDDAPHYLVTHGEPPTNIRLPVLLFTSNYYLTDVDEPKHGGTECVKGSHMFGRGCPQLNEKEHADIMKKIDHNCAPMGSVVLFNNQCWHRGGPNMSDRTRYVTQISYGRRLIGHKYAPFMNYVMPEHCYKDAGPRLKRLLGFLPSGAYG